MRNKPSWNWNITGETRRVAGFDGEPEPTRTPSLFLVFLALFLTIAACVVLSVTP
jgi:hypothetical protein